MSEADEVRQQLRELGYAVDTDEELVDAAAAAYGMTRAGAIAMLTAAEPITNRPTGSPLSPA